MDYQAYYDTVLNITWIADANLAATNTFGVSGLCTNNDYPCNGIGTMNWSKATEWVAAMNSANYLGVNDWRLPIIVDTGPPGCDWSYGGTDCQQNVQTKSGNVFQYEAGQTVYSEMAHLYYVTLGNVGYYDTSGNLTGCSQTVPPYCLAHSSPFHNVQTKIYWSGWTSVTYSGDAWGFGFAGGTQYDFGKFNGFSVWSVRDGDLGAAVVPIPAAAWLLGSALWVLGWMRRRVA
jgi:hypothetical protein